MSDKTNVLRYMSSWHTKASKEPFYSYIIHVGWNRDSIGSLTVLRFCVNYTMVWGSRPRVASLDFVSLCLSDEHFVLWGFFGGGIFGDYCDQVLNVILNINHYRFLMQTYGEICTGYNYCRYAPFKQKTLC